MAQVTIQQTLNLAMQHHRAGRLPEAERLGRQILAQQPNHAQALHLLGVIAAQLGSPGAAADLIRQAIALSPNDAEAHYHLGDALMDNGRPDEAIAAYRKAIALRPNYAEAYGGLGNALQDNGQIEEAIVAYRQAIIHRPDWAEAHNNLGDALTYKGQLVEAIAAYRHATALKPDYAEAYSNLGETLRQRGQLDEAVAACRQAIALNPNFPEAHCNLGNALKGNGQLDEAIAAYRQAITLRPGYAEAYSNLGEAQREKGQLEDAIASCRQAIACNSGLWAAHYNLGNALTLKGQLDEAIAAYRQAIAIDPASAWIDSSFIYMLHFHPAYDAGMIAQEHRRWSSQHAEPLRQLIEPHNNQRSPERRLRLGYVSPNFRDHVVGRNLLPLLLHHDRRQFHITCYSNARHPDALTRQFQQNVGAWQDIVDLSTEQAARQVRADQIDILVDLALHMGGSRLLTFARKPAPVQVTFAGYPGSTGLKAIDYRLSDPYLDPPGMDESIYSEKTIRLPNSFWCYDPLECRDIPINQSPSAGSGFLTFGCLNNFCKVNDLAVSLWRQALQRVEESRLLLLAPQGSHRQWLLERLAREGIDSSRIEFAAPRPRREYLRLYHRIDLCLDTFPYNGHTTSLDSFWMGVPVVTLVGQTAVSRAGWCQLSNLGLEELAAQTPEQFVDIAVELAKDLPRLQVLRSTLRQRMERSPLMDAPRFARNIEAAYRQMWRTWCAAVPTS